MLRKLRRKAHHLKALKADKAVVESALGNSSQR